MAIVIFSTQVEKDDDEPLYRGVRELEFRAVYSYWSSFEQFWSKKFMVMNWKKLKL